MIELERLHNTTTKQIRKMYILKARTEMIQNQYLFFRENKPFKIYES